MIQAFELILGGTDRRDHGTLARDLGAAANEVARVRLGANPRPVRVGLLGHLRRRDHEPR